MLPEHAAYKPPESDELGSAIPANIGEDGHIVPDDEALEYMVTIPDVRDVSVYLNSGV